MSKGEFDYEEVNRRSWNNKVEAHLKSDFYDMESFLNGKSSLRHIELEHLGDLRGKRVLHLQCHFGQDSISLSRMGAQVVGVDLSDASIAMAKELAKETQSNAEFICCNVYDIPKHLEGQFDLVFTSYGTIAWLPDLDKWASIVSSMTKPGGRFLMVDFHPFIWMYDDDFQRISYDYFKGMPIVGSEEGTYADKASTVKHDYICWNHSLSETIGSLLRIGLTLTRFEELDYSPYDCLSNMKKFEEECYRVSKFSTRVPHVFVIEAQQ